jgi:hypothetical protein
MLLLATLQAGKSGPLVISVASYGVRHAVCFSAWRRVPHAETGDKGTREMIPETVYCEDCGQIAGVRGYGRVEYEWPKTARDGQVAANPVISSIRLTVDCPCCGVKSQDHCPNDPSHSGANRRPSEARPLASRPTRINYFAPRRLK